MFNFMALITMAEEVAAELPAVETAASKAVAAAKALLADPAVQKIEAELASLLHLTSTPGAAAVIEPKSTGAAR